MGGSTLGSLSQKDIDNYAMQDVESLTNEQADFFTDHDTHELGSLATAAFRRGNRELLDAIAQHAFTKAADYVTQPDLFEPYANLYRHTEDHVDKLIQGPKSSEVGHSA